LITSSDVSNASSAGLKKRVGVDFALGPPLYAISRSNWSPESAEVRLLLGRSLAEGVPGSARTGLQFNNPTSNDEDKKI
jgi:hypothetical protein